MKEKKRYFRIGLFVIVSAAIFVAILILLGAGSWFEEPFMMETYFDSSVQGLSVGSPVKYRGVKIGEIKEITFVHAEYDLHPSAEPFYKYGKYVLIKIALNQDAFRSDAPHEVEEVMRKLINEDGLRLRLAYIGVTGLAYLELDYVDPAVNVPLDIGWEPKSLYVPSAPNTIARIEDSLNQLMTAMDNDLFPTLENFNKAAEDIPIATNKLNETLSILSDLLSEQRYSFTEIVENIRVFTEDAREFVSMIKKYPSQLILSKEPPKEHFKNEK